MTYTRKAIVRRLVLLGAMVFLSLTALTAAFLAGRTARRAYSGQAQVGLCTGHVLHLLSSVGFGCRQVSSAVEPTERGMTHLLVQYDLAERRAVELTEALRSAGMPVRADRVVRGWGKLAAARAALDTAQPPDPDAVRHLGWEVNALRDSISVTTYKACRLLDGKARRAERLALAGALCYVVALAAGLLAGLLLASDALGEMLGPVDLEAALDEVAQSPQFRHRLSMLSSDPDARQDAPWRLALGEVLHRRRTHTTFEAVAERGAERIRLWGKCYRWAGVMKGLQRPFAPAYAKATWRALCRMDSSGLSAPFPLTTHRIRRGPLSVGMIVLAEHVGTTESVKDFIQTKFLQMDGTGRAEFLKRMVEHWNALHACGLVSLSPRYLHCAAGQSDQARFYLFDLDKVRPGRACAGLLARLRAARDNRRLLSWLEPHVTPEELRLVTELVA